MGLASVLIVDDDPTLRRVVTCFLQELGQDQVVVVDSAGGGQEALTKAHSLQPDIVLIDLVLPDLHGLEVVSRLHATVPHVRIIAMSQHHVDGYRQASLEAGADAFVFKATLNTALLPAIRRVKDVEQTQEKAGEDCLQEGIQVIPGHLHQEQER